MADEDYRWLDREAAERLLRGEPLETVDAGTKERVERLTEALASLVAEPAPGGAELPGEAAALAAFRAARASRDGVPAQLAAGRDPRAAAHSADAGLVRLGSPGPGGHRARWGRPVRFGLAAVLAVGMIGGVAVAAGTGVLPTPFRDDRPHPAATVSAAQTPQHPMVSPSPGESQADGSEVPLPGATASGPAGSGSSDDVVVAAPRADSPPRPSRVGQPAPTSGGARRARRAGRSWAARTWRRPQTRPDGRGGRRRPREDVLQACPGPDGSRFRRGPGRPGRSGRRAGRPRFRARLRRRQGWRRRRPHGPG
ncbi:hypothetical protein ACFQ51_25785 [Streptomyces kaempferi]